MGCASSSETKHVIYVKPRVVNGTNSVNGLEQINSNHSHSEQRSDKTANNNNANINDHMLSSRDKEIDKTAEPRETSCLDNKAERKVINKDIGCLIEPGHEDVIKDKARRLSHQDEVTDNVRRSSIDIEGRIGKESGKKINRKVSDARTNPSSITEWETDSELAVDKEIDDVDATGKTVIETNNRESSHVIAGHVGTDENEKAGEKFNDSAIKAFASYVGSGIDEKHSDGSRENLNSPQHLNAAIKLHDGINERDGKSKQTENRQWQEEIVHDTDEVDAKRDDPKEDKEEQNFSDTEDTGPAPTLVKAKDIMPSADTLKVLADQVKKSPIALKPSLASLVKRLTKPATTDLEKVWAFYRWIVINIKYDVDGFFGDAPAKSSDPSAVLKTGVALCDGYTNLLMAFCEKSNVEAKTISGFAKPYGYTIGDDVSTLESCKHKWNAVRIDRRWLLMDCTWGAGFVKPKDKRYIRWPNDFYFLTDPEIFISDHFPMMDNDYEKSCKWQLLEMPLTLEIFMKRVNMDQPGKEWGIRTHHHPYAVIDVQNEAEIMTEESHTPMLDYMVHMRNNEFQLMDPFIFCYKLDAKTFKVHVRPPAVGEYMCQIYGRRVVDGKDAHFQPLVLYKLDCTEVYDRPREFPKHDTVFGPVFDIERFGFSHTGNVLYKAEFGEITILLNPTREVHFVPHLYIGDTEFDYLRENCLVQYSEDFRHVSISLRLPFEGFFRLTLFGKRGEKKADDDGLSNKSTSTPVYNVKFRRPQSNSSRTSVAEMKPFVSYLIDNRQASDKDPFPFAHSNVLKYKCCLLQPADKEVKTEREIKVCLRSLFLERVKAGDDLIPKVDESTFAGNTVTTKSDAKFIIYGSESKNGDDFVPLYECTTSK